MEAERSVFLFDLLICSGQITSDHIRAGETGLGDGGVERGVAMVRILVSPMGPEDTVKGSWA